MSISESLRKSSLTSIVVFGLLAFLILYLIIGFITCGRSAIDSMFIDKNDIFMDYFNSIYYSLDNPYTNHSVIYPPLITCIYGLIGNFISIDGTIYAFDLRSSYLGLFSYTIVVIISVISLQKLSVIYSKKKCLIATFAIILILFSYPVLFAIMRGNCILYSLIFVMLFLLGYRSENKTVRYLSYLCLGIAAGFKIYVALFGILVLRERNVKDILICAVIGVAILMIPFIFTDGNLILFLKNAFGYSSVSSSATQIINVSDIFSVLTSVGLNKNVSSILSISIIILSYLLTLLIIVFNKNIREWEAVALISANIIFGFGPSVAYVLVFMIPALLLFLREESDKNVKNICLAVLFVIIFAVFPGIDALGKTAYFVTIKGMSVMMVYCGVIVSIIDRYGFIDKCANGFKWIK